MRIGSLTLLLIVAGTTSCAPNAYKPGESYTPEEVQSVNDTREDELRTRAACELRCEDLEIVCLKKRVDGICVTAGVDGCGQRATYVLTQLSVSRADWVLDGVNGAKVEADAQ